MSGVSSSPRFFSAILTAPRPDGVSYLEDTFASVYRAGFNPWLVSHEPIPGNFQHPYESALRLLPHNRPGAWQGWLVAAGFLAGELERYGNPARDWIVILEDDLELTENLAAYLLASPPPDHALASLYCAATNAPPPETILMTPWQPVRVPQRAHGALAYLLRLDTCRRILENPPHPTQPHGTDHNLGLFCRAQEVPYLVHSPSLAVHRGAVSSLPDAGTSAARQCREWASRYDGHAPCGHPFFSITTPQDSPAGTPAGRVADPAGPTQ